MNIALELSEVTKRFGDFTAVDHLSMQVPEGCIFGFLGPNGSGKTTTMRMIMSIFHPDEGSIRILGHSDAAAVKDRLGYLPEEKGLYKKMKAGEIVAYFGMLKGLDKKTAKRRAIELLERFGLGEWIDKRCESLSKGMSQKVQLLGTLIHEPDLVILDEPFSGLDPINMETMRDTIRDLGRRGRTVVFSTHVMAQAEELCDYILLIHGGRKKLAGSLEEVRGGDARALFLDYDGDGSFLQEHPAIERLNDAGKRAEIYLRAGEDPQAFLRDVAGRLRIQRFEIRRPSLHEVYVRTIGAAEAAEEV